MRPPTTPHTKLVFSPLVGMLAGFCHSKGVDPSATLTRLGITAAQLADQEARVPYEALLGLWEDLIAARPDEPLGLEYASLVDMASLGLYALLGLHSENIEAGIRRSIRFQRLFDPELDLDLELTDTTAIVRIHHAIEDSHPEIMEMMLAAMCLYARAQLSDAQLAEYGALDPFEMRLKHAQRHPERAYIERTGARVRFDAPRHEVHLPRRWLSLPVEHATPGVTMYLERALLEHERAESRAPTFAERVRAQIAQALAEGEISQDAIARRLSVSARTLQRRLRGDDVTFAALLEAERRDQAERLLGQLDLPVYAVAYALGYSEPSTFYRAFKRWTGETPQSFRHSLTSRP